ncbi:hypothetical protein GUITHDRAFT_99489 [Guillardia theta CCMP2712]|uniref:RWP-RK domain-containing protein n=1 Tax=Guillardia theta (strain CCMP2712) TaxID=905079 RepID=L1K2M2_GUITC|nr:hypothetical protein GUITHDRAFT_99489 [Guillardia theta CCMP2712]EKX54839.1 hypothetical protein GUITHDRAFT_99489 [Guillardia theta CCMP2712]|eukprot:XP_005841819.1 hypothetical protein GUITHDRAFT_99489 [Guillardia theta CCMP2712]
MSHTVTVRGRAGSTKGARARPVELTLAKLELLYELRQEEAANCLGISLTSLKSACRRLGLTRWPYTRSIRSSSSFLQQTAQVAATYDRSNGPRATTPTPHHDAPASSPMLTGCPHELAQAPDAHHAHGASVQPEEHSLTARVTLEELRILGEWDEEHSQLLVNNEWIDYILSSGESTDVDMSPGGASSSSRSERTLDGPATKQDCWLRCARSQSPAIEQDDEAAADAAAGGA